MARTKAISVQFHFAVPRDGVDWPEGRFPADDVLDVVDALPPDKRRVATSLYTEKVGLVLGERPRRLLSVENVELGGQIRESIRGTISIHQYGKDAGPAAPTWAMFLEDNVVGIVRLGGGPDAAGVAGFLEVLAGCSLKLVPIENPEVMSRLRGRQGKEVSRVKLTTASGRAGHLSTSTALGKALNEVEKASPGVEEITLIIGVKATQRRERWWRGVRRQIEKLASDEEALSQFDTAEVYVEGEKPVDLLTDLVTWRHSVPTDSSRHLTEDVVAAAIQQAYAERRPTIRAALDLHRTET